MAAKVSYKASVKKDLKNPDRSTVVLILDAIEKNLSANPGKDKILKGQFEGLFSYRVGDWRVIYSLIGDAILVLRIVHGRKAE